MTKFDIPPQLALPETRFRKVRNGTVGIVFNISDEYAAKVLFSGDVNKDIEDYLIRDDDEAIRKLTYESEIADKLYRRKISIPTPVGIEELVIFFNKSYPAFIMEYLPFPTGADLSYLDFEKARRLALKEVEKAMDMDFTPGGDCLNPNNFLYNKEKNRVYLIDFEKWSYEGQELNNNHN